MPAGRLGLVELTTDDQGRVHLEAYPPGKDPVDLQLSPDDARGLASGLLEAAEQAEQPYANVVDGVPVPDPDPAPLPATYGRAAYEAYREHCGGRSVRGDPLPTWPRQRPQMRGHWTAAAAAVLAAAGLPADSCAGGHDGA